MNKRVLIADTGAWSPDVLEAVEECGVIVDGFVEFYDGAKCDKLYGGKTAIWWENAAMYAGTHVIVHGLGTRDRRDIVSRAHSVGLKFATVKHPTARIPKSCKLGYGTFVGPGVVMGSQTTTGIHTTINRGALIGHDVVLGDYVTVSPGANIAGCCKVGNGSYVAMGALMLDNQSIAQDTIVAAGALVTKTYTESNIKLMGIPARIKERNIRGK